MALLRSINEIMVLSWLRGIASYIWGSSEQTVGLSLEEAYKMFESVDESPEKPALSTTENVTSEETSSDYVCYHRSGKITSALRNNYKVDEIFTFQSDLKGLKVGTPITYTTYSIDDKINVCNVAIVFNDWGHQEEEGKNFWSYRHLITKVVKRDVRLITVNPGDLTIDLNTTPSEFVPIVGDWLELEAKVEIEENAFDLFGEILSVDKIRPLRPKVQESVIKLWDGKVGNVGNHSFFNRDALTPGYIPAIGDKVIVEAIESDQGAFTWRALKVLPLNSSKPKFQPPSENFIDNITGVVITDDINVHVENLCQQRNIEVKILNNNEQMELKNITFECDDSQLKLISEFTWPKILKKEESVTCQILYTAKYSNTMQELIVFYINDMKVGRWVQIHFKNKPAPSNDKFKRIPLVPTNINKNDGREYVRGQRVIVSPRFIAVRLPEYPVPQKLWDLLVNGDDCTEAIDKQKPCLVLPLSFNVYEDRFHTLLHIFEIQDLIEVQRYNMEQVSFIEDGDYLMLEIDNLSERRPSLIVGDRVMAKNPHNLDEMELEGYIHKIGSKHIKIKFAQMFHDSYKGEDMSIRIIMSRTKFRRMHQAIGLAARNLGAEILFPSKVLEKDPQIHFTCEDNKQITMSQYERYFSLHIDLLRRRESERNVKANKLKRNVDLRTHLSPCKNIEPGKSQLLLESNEETKIFVAPKDTVLNLDWYNKSLNFQQQEAVKNILTGKGRPLPYIIFGPPGTGKTVTLIESILQILRLLPHSRLLVGTPSNSAADLIALRLIDSGILKPGDILRLVAYRYVSENHIPMKLVPFSATFNIAQEGTHSNKIEVTEKGLSLGCGSAVIGRHRITVGTCSALAGLYSTGFAKGHFTHIFVDEAGQAIEPEIMIPLSFLDTSNGQAVLAGDPMQLGPAINSKLASHYGLGESFLERLLSRFPYIKDSIGFPDTGSYDPRLVTKLIYNYRSLPNILSLSSSLFYNDELRATISPSDSIEAQLLQQVKEILPQQTDDPFPMLFHGVQGDNYQSFDSPSWYNPNEVSRVFYYVNELFRLGISAKDIGIITPYIKQAREIRNILIEAEFELPKIGTIEEFQGQELNVILLSTVRSTKSFVDSDKRYCLGVVANPKRLNVALTRARALLIIIGNPFLLSMDNYWCSVLNYCLKNNVYCGCKFVAAT